MPPIKKRLADIPVPQARKGPLWKGPEEDGVTYSLLSRFLVCRERFRLLVVEGLKPTDTFNPRLEFGNLWHIAEEWYVGYGGVLNDKSDGRLTAALEATKRYAQGLLRKYPTAADQIDTWYGIAKTLFPLYVEFWTGHPDTKPRKPLLSEETFDVPYRLPSGRTVRLRGKWDSVDLEGAGRQAGIVLQENKTKSDPDPEAIGRQLTFDLQTMLYVVALEEHIKRGTGGVHSTNWNGQPVKGVRYNVVKRPRQYQGKKETRQGFLDRLGGIVAANPEEWFFRWDVLVSSADVERFRRQCLDPILMQLCQWWDQVGCGDPWDGRNRDHWRHPFGVYNVLDEGGASDLDHYLATGSEVGLTRTDNLYPELT